MFNRFWELLKTIIGIGEAMAQNKSEIKELQREVRQLSTAMQLLAREIQYSRETDRLERDKFRLQIENDLLKRLPPPKDE